MSVFAFSSSLPAAEQEVVEIIGEVSDGSQTSQAVEEKPQPNFQVIRSAIRKSGQHTFYLKEVVPPQNVAPSLTAALEEQQTVAWGDHPQDQNTPDNSHPEGVAEGTGTQSAPDQPTIADANNVKRNSPTAGSPATAGYTSSLYLLTAQVYGTGEKKVSRFTIGLSNQSLSGWIDFDARHLGGFSGYRVGDRSYHHLLSVSNATHSDGRIKSLEDARTEGFGSGKLHVHRGFFYTLDENSPQDILLDDLLKLYAAEATRLRTAHQARLTHNVKPNNLNPNTSTTIHFWENPSPQQQPEKGASK